MMREEQVQLSLGAEEYSIVVGALADKRNDLLEDSLPTDEIDNIIEKAAVAPVKKVRVKDGDSIR